MEKKDCKNYRRKKCSKNKENTEYDFSQAGEKMMKRSLTVSLQSVFLYVIIIGFLFPRGYIGVSEIYHKVCSVTMWLSVILTWLQWIKCSRTRSKLFKGKIEKHVLQITTYFILAIIITMVCRRSVSSGLQQLLAAPSVCVFMILNMKRNPKKLLDNIANVLCVEFTINLVMTLLQPDFYGLYHTIFLGHIQVVSQYGVLAILVSVLSWMLYHDRTKRIVYLFIITLYTMLTTDAEAAVFTAIAFLIAFVIYKWKLSQLLMLPSEAYIIVMVALSALIVYFSAVNTNVLSYLDINGRSFVWKSALEKIELRPIFGYGVDGVLLSTFWTKGFNYAHNQLVQNLLDGGVILMISFWGMILGFAKDINKIKITRYRVLCNASLIALLFIMLFESTTLYIYMYMILSIIFSVRTLLKIDRR